MTFGESPHRHCFVCIIGYLFEVLHMEQRNFSNVLEIRHMNNLDEHADCAEK